MGENQYRIELKKVLDAHKSNAEKRLDMIFKSLPENTKSIELMIFPDQDGEGTFSVRVSLSGPDLYVLNKAIEDTADIFNVKHTSQGLEPNVPMMDPFNSSFDINDVLVDVVGNWVKSIWDIISTENIKLPVTILADEGYGTKLPIKLK
tara:strand:+ start:3317 stop:3763 length:447 start_codon:yes stop_codon:yes gene_type:complete